MTNNINKKNKRSELTESEVVAQNCNILGKISADIAFGFVNGGSAPYDGSLQAAYGYQLDLKTSFEPGTDSLEISIDGGKSSDDMPGSLYELDLNNTSNRFVVDGVSYYRKLSNEAAIAVGDNIDGSFLYNIACKYNGGSNTLNDCGNIYSAPGGQTAAICFRYVFSKELQVSAFVGGNDKLENIGFNLSYEVNNSGEPNYGVSFAYADYDQTYLNGDHYGLNAYFNNEDIRVPSISVGYEWGETSAGGTVTDSYFVGLQWDNIGINQEDSAGIAFGTKTPTVYGSEEELMYEAFYTYTVNDNVKITPLIYSKDYSATGVDDETGVMVKTSFSF